MAFQKSAAKGRSKVERLNSLVRELFALMLLYQCVLEFFWLSSEDNLLADDLSRNRENAFLQHAFDTQFWEQDTTPVRHEGAGQKRTLPQNRGTVNVAQVTTQRARKVEHIVKAAGDSTHTRLVRGQAAKDKPDRSGPRD